MGVNFQTCTDEFAEDNFGSAGGKGGAFRGANSSQKF